jgi:hypothetical protein
MHILLSFMVYTANILGILSDPFEFEGDAGQYGGVRQRVFEKLVGHEEDEDYGPTWEDLGLSSDLADVKPYAWFRQLPPSYLKLDKELRDRFAREGEPFDLPIVSSIGQLEGQSVEALNMNLLDALLELGYSPEEMAIYWMYQALNFHLVCDSSEHIQEINEVKEWFKEGLGNARVRANFWKEKFADAAVLFTQESDAALVEEVNNLFWPVDKQQPQDGTFVFLSRAFFKPDYEVIAINDYDGYQKGRLNVVLATTIEDKKVLLASCHGHSTRAEDGREQISKVVEAFEKLKEKIGALELLIGIDANTKNEAQVAQFRNHLDQLGLVATDVGPTTVKKRMVTVQHGKSNKVVVDEEDYLITLKEGNFLLTDQMAGFKEGPVDSNRFLPDQENPSDHYPVGAVVHELPLL